MKARGRYQKDGAFAQRLQDARGLGYARGYAGKQHEIRNYVTGAEWIAWLKGWRQGMADRRRDIAAQAEALATEERIMRRVLVQTFGD